MLHFNIHYDIYFFYSNDILWKNEIYWEHNVVFSFFMREHSQVSSRLWVQHIRLVKTLRGCQTTGKIAVFSIHSNKFYLTEDVYIIVNAPPPPQHPLVMLRSVVAQGYSIRLEIER